MVHIPCPYPLVFSLQMLRILSSNSICGEQISSMVWNLAYNDQGLCVIKKHDWNNSKISRTRIINISCMGRKLKSKFSFIKVFHGFWPKLLTHYGHLKDVILGLERKFLPNMIELVCMDIRHMQFLLGWWKEATWRNMNTAWCTWALILSVASIAFTLALNISPQWRSSLGDFTSDLYRNNVQEKGEWNTYS